MKILPTLLLAILMTFSGSIFADGSPIPNMERVADQVLDELKQNKSRLKNNPQIVYNVVKKHFLPQVDVEGMSRSVLGRQAWNKATPMERKQFAEAFTNLVIHTYASPLTEYTDEKVKFLPSRHAGNDRFMRVNSLIIRSHGQNIPLNYSLVLKNGNWKIYDMSVEGVSLLQSFKSQFAQALQNSTMRELIQQMEQKRKKAA